LTGYKQLGSPSVKNPPKNHRSTPISAGIYSQQEPPSIGGQDPWKTSTSVSDFDPTYLRMNCSKKIFWVIDRDGEDFIFKIEQGIHQGTTA
jgi:hypothetical protein